MADYYLDHGAYGTSTNRLGLDAPTTWGVPQEGDGNALTASTAAAVAEIKINAVPTASETITIAGAVITAGASAAANVFVRGAAPSNTATNIVTLINSANFTNTVGTSVAHNTGIASTANQGRNMFFARVKSGATDTVQIMFRYGSDALNHANNSNVAITTSGWGTAPTITQFTGGVSGCFGWLINPVALGQGSSITVNLYGLLMAKPTVIRGATSAVSTFALSESDTVWMRSGAGQTISPTLGTSNTDRPVNTNGLNLVLDTNTKWTGDSGTGVISVDFTQNAGSSTLRWCQGNAMFFTSLGTKRLKFRRVGNNNGALGFSVASSGNLLFRNVIFEDASANITGGITPLAYLSGTNATTTARYENCEFNWPTARATGVQFSAVGETGSSANTKDVVLVNCDVAQNYTGSINPTNALFPLNSTVAANVKLEWYGGKITGLGSYKQPIFSGAVTGGPAIMLRAENILNAAIPGTGLSGWHYGNGAEEERRRCFYSTASPGRSWRWESAAGLADWISDASPAFPLLNGRMLDNTQWSMRALWVFGTGQDITRGFTVPAMRQVSRGSTGSKTFLLEMLVPTAITLTQGNLRIVVQYYDNSGNPITEIKTGADIAASTASWTNAASYPNHSAKKLTFTTAQQVAQYSDVIVTPTLYGSSPTGANAEVYFDPGFTLT